MEWDDVRVLLALFRHGNLNDAAARLGVDRSTISRRLDALEQSIGARLFVRTRDGLRPTTAAGRVRTHAERMETEAAALERGAKSTARSAEGVVRIATTESFGALLVSEGLLGIQDDHPDLSIEIIGGNQVVDLTRGEADIALRLTPVREATLHAKRLASVAIGLYAAPSYLRTRPLTSLASLAGHDVLLATGDIARLPEARWLASQPGVRPVFRSNSMPTLLEAAAAGRGLLPLPLPYGDGEPRLERVAVLENIPRRTMWLVTPAEGTTRLAVRVVRDRIAAIVTKPRATR